jgi:hypothetical protein
MLYFCALTIWVTGTTQEPHSLLIQRLLSLEWWIEVFVAGIVVHIIAQTLHNRLGSWSVSARSKLRLATEAKRIERADLVTQVRQDQYKETLLYLGMIHDRIEAAFLWLAMATGIILASLSSPVFLVILMFSFGVISGLRSIMMILKADRKRSILLEAHAGDESAKPPPA